MKRLFFFYALCLLSTGLAFAQTYELKGKITQNGKDLPNAGVYISILDKGTYSDEKGNYSLQLPEGTYEVEFFYGHTLTKTVHLDDDQVLNVEIADFIDALEAVFLSAFRVDADSPITFSNLENEEIEERNLGQDIPFLMNYMPNVVTTSDAGAGIGYTGMRVRGSDATRVNTTINGVPLNDGESQGVFWVNLGDFTSSVENLQLQRGVGTSTNGAGAFGASLNIMTDEILEDPSLEIGNTYGSFNSHKHFIKFNTGRLNERFAFSGNLGLAESDGYRDRSFSDFTSYFLQGTYQYNRTLIKALGFGGKQQTYQAYYGLTPEELKENRRFNPAGMYFDKNGEVKFYDQQTDNYEQDHFQLLWNQRFAENWSSNLSFHYTYGKGYYESYKQDADLYKYGLPYFEHNGQQVTQSDLINQKWLDNHFYGTVFDFTYKKEDLKLVLGGAWNRYWGDHYGQVIHTEFAQVEKPFAHYYDNEAEKYDYNFYGKLTTNLTDQWAAFADLQLRNISYKTEGPYENTEFNLKDDFTFFNPKIGFNYHLNKKNQFYLSYARANREPNRSDYKTALLNGNPQAEYPKAEQLDDFELGWRHKSTNFWINANAYFMDYHNQLVLTGELDPEGRTLRKNSGESYRLGIELDASWRLWPTLSWNPNISLSQNKNRSFIAEENGTLINYGTTDISFSPSIVAGNSIRFIPLDRLKLIVLSKYVGQQYMSNTEAQGSKLASYFVHDFNVQYSLNESIFFKKVVFKGLINNLLNKKYSSNGSYSPAYGPYYYPQAGINFLLGMNLYF